MKSLGIIVVFFRRLTVCVWIEVIIGGTSTNEYQKYEHAIVVDALVVKGELYFARGKSCGAINSNLSKAIRYKIMKPQMKQLDYVTIFYPNNVINRYCNSVVSSVICPVTTHWRISNSMSNVNSVNEINVL